ncbi:MAG: LacI family DNA-binding transcriptional regulator [Phototrophicaceae bacterium]|jgi:LacI family fructose operon transcriptional repressor
MSNIKEVAARAGVSVATVSRVLSNKNSVRPQTREVVMRVIEELSYRPNRVASSLRRQKANVIGLLVSDIMNPFFTEIARAIEDVANQYQMGVFFCNTDEDPQKEKRYLQTLLDENVAGIILSPTASPIEHFQFLFEDATPIVVIDRRIPSATVDCVLSDNLQAATLLTEHLIQQGYKRIAAVIGLKAVTTGQERMQGYLQAMHAYGLEPLCAFTPPREKEGEQVVYQWLSAGQLPDAILTGNSRLTIGAINAIKSAGLTISKDIGLAGFDETIWAAHIGSGLTVIRQPTYEMGQTAAELLLQRIDAPQRAAREVILRGNLIQRGSTAFRVK